MTPNSSSGPGRRPVKGSAPRGSAAPRRKPGPPASSGKTPPRPAAKPPKPAERKPPAKQPPAKAKQPPAKQPAARKPPPRPPSAKQSRTGARRPVSASHSTGLLPQYAPARPRPVVSKTSAQRFAAKVRARRRRQTMIAVATVLVLTAGGWVTVFAPWATVKEVTVSGLDRVDEADVRAAAETELGHSLLLARTADVSARLKRLRLVKNVQVSRVWPGTLEVRVNERQPVAALPSGTVAGNSTSGTAKDPMLMVQLVDDEGVVIETVPAGRAPEGLPRIEVALGGKQSVANLRGTLAVLESLPPNLSSRLKAIGASSPDGIWLRLSAPLQEAPKRTVLVQWGDSAQGPQKARVLSVLLEKKAKTYDVRAPEMPSTAS